MCTSRLGGKSNRRRHQVMLTWLLGTDGDWLIAIVRIVLGVVFFAHGAQKTLGWFGGAGLQSTVRTFREHLRIPAPLALLAFPADFLIALVLYVRLLNQISLLSIPLT